VNRKTSLRRMPRHPCIRTQSDSFGPTHVRPVDDPVDDLGDKLGMTTQNLWATPDYMWTSYSVVTTRCRGNRRRAAGRMQPPAWRVLPDLSPPRPANRRPRGMTQGNIKGTQRRRRVFSAGRSGVDQKYSRAQVSNTNPNQPTGVRGTAMRWPARRAALGSAFRSMILSTVSRRSTDGATCPAICHSVSPGITTR
jgi:hypothetical protein